MKKRAHLWRKEQNDGNIRTGNNRILLRALSVYRCGPGRFDEIDLPDKREGAESAVHGQGRCDPYAQGP